LLVKNNAGRAVIDNPVIAAKDRDAVIIEASSSIIEVLKNQMENGKLNDLIKFFKYSGIYSTALISSMVNRFANKLNKFYGIEPEAAHKYSQHVDSRCVATTHFAITKWRRKGICIGQYAI